MWRHLLYPLLPYRSFLGPIAVAWAVVLPVWLGVRWMRRRQAASRVTAARELLLLVFALYLAALAAVTLSPNDSARLREAGTGGIDLQLSAASLTCTGPTVPDGSRAQGFCMHNARGNVALFVPFGFLVPLIWPSVRLRRGVLLALLLSCGIEVTQYVSSAWGSYRAADVNDVVLNVVGATIGLLLARVVRLLPLGRTG